MGYQILGTIGASTMDTTDVPYKKNVQWGEARLEPLATSQNATRLEFLASPMLQTLQDTTSLKPLASPHGTNLIKPSVWA